MGGDQEEKRAFDSKREAGGGKGADHLAPTFDEGEETREGGWGEDDGDGKGKGKGKGAKAGYEVPMDFRPPPGMGEGGRKSEGKGKGKGGSFGPAADRPTQLAVCAIPEATTSHTQTPTLTLTGPGRSSATTPRS